MNKKTLLSLGIITVVLFLTMTIFTVVRVEANWPGLLTGQVLVVSKGTPVNLTSIPIEEGMNLVIKAMTTNTGKITLGYSSATALNSGTGWFSLYPGESVELNITNLNLVWMDGESGEGVEWITEQD